MVAQTILAPMMLPFMILGSDEVGNCITCWIYISATMIEKESVERSEYLRWVLLRHEITSTHFYSSMYCSKLHDETVSSDTCLKKARGKKLKNCCNDIFACCLLTNKVIAGIFPLSYVLRSLQSQLKEDIPRKDDHVFFHKQFFFTEWNSLRR